MKKFLYILLLVFTSLLVACEEDEKYAVYSCETWPAKYINRTTVTLHAKVNIVYGTADQHVVIFTISDNEDFQNPITWTAYQDNVYSYDDHVYRADVSDLTPNTKYYYYASIKRADYGKNELKGETLSFTTKSYNIPTGAAKGLFTVGSGKKQVFFAKGNLQYQASTKTWRFAEHQYDYIGDGNLNVSATYSGWIDLFGHGTSGYNGRYPYNTWDDDTESYGNPNGDLDGTDYDWGVYNAISNGGNQKNQWRTMSSSECNYLFKKRSNASNLYGYAQIAGTNGLIILPDDWVAPSGISFTSGIHTFLTNNYTLEQWTKMEDAGAVFLPAAGARGFRFNSPYSGYNDIDMRGVNEYGYYRLSTAEWSSITNKPDFGHILDFRSNDGSLSGSNYGAMEMGWSVRLIQDDK